MPADASTSAEGITPCLLVPVYEHHEALRAHWGALLDLGLPVVLVDDGSSEACAAALRGLAEGSRVRLLRRARNGGKGAAVKDGLRWASAAGFSHALQIDADGQHDLGAVAAMLEAARKEPAAAVCARPVFGADAPRSRLGWRRLTNLWLAINSLSLGIPDGQCGLRVYPLAAVLPLADRCGDRMDFDPEILVRLSWAGTPLRFLPAVVRYPAGGSSGFRLIEDNARISWMHMRLFFGMLLRLPRILVRRAQA